MISLTKRAIIIATVAGTALLGGTATALACPGDAEGSGTVQQITPGQTGQTGEGGELEQQGAAAGPLSAACTAVIADLAQNRAAPFNQATSAVASACSADDVALGEVIDYVGGQVG